LHRIRAFGGLLKKAGLLKGKGIHLHDGIDRRHVVLVHLGLNLIRRVDGVLLYIRILHLNIRIMGWQLGILVKLRLRLK
jgi:hypothetical protein